MAEKRSIVRSHVWYGAQFVDTVLPYSIRATKMGVRKGARDWAGKSWEYLSRKGYKIVPVAVSYEVEV